MSLRKEIGEANLRKSDDLCKMVEELGYRNGNSLPGLQLNNGSYATSLLNFFDDNPDAMETLRDWILENSSSLEAFDDDSEEEEEEEEEETDES